MFAASLEWSFPVYFLVVCNFVFVFPSRLPCRDRGSGSCFTGHLPGIGNLFILVWRFRISGGGDAAIKQGQLVAMRHGKKKIIYGMHLSAVLLQEPAPDTWSDITYKHF